jgi:hypothetical protein
MVAEDDLTCDFEVARYSFQFDVNDMEQVTVIVVPSDVFAVLVRSLSFFSMPTVWYEKFVRYKNIIRHRKGNSNA